MSEVLRQPETVAPVRRLAWLDGSDREVSAKIEAHLWPYVDALGIELATEFLLTFGGAPVYVGSRANNGSAIGRFLGSEAVLRLSSALGQTGYVRVPTATRFVIQALRSQSLSIGEIARLTRRTYKTVANYLAGKRTEKNWDALYDD